MSTSANVNRLKETRTSSIWVTSIESEPLPDSLHLKPPSGTSGPGPAMCQSTEMENMWTIPLPQSSGQSQPQKKTFSLSDVNLHVNEAVNEKCKNWGRWNLVEFRDTTVAVTLVGGWLHMTGDFWSPAVETLIFSTSPCRCWGRGTLKMQRTHEFVVFRCRSGCWAHAFSTGAASLLKQSELWPHLLRPRHPCLSSSVMDTDLCSSARIRGVFSSAPCPCSQFVMILVFLVMFGVLISALRVAQCHWGHFVSLETLLLPPSPQFSFLNLRPMNGSTLWTFSMATAVNSSYVIFSHLKQHDVTF